MYYIWIKILLYLYLSQVSNAQLSLVTVFIHCGYGMNFSKQVA